MKYNIGDVWFFNEKDYKTELQILESNVLSNAVALQEYCKANDIPFNLENLLQGGQTMIEEYRKAALKQIKGISAFGVLKTSLHKELSNSINIIENYIDKIVSYENLDDQMILFDGSKLSINIEYLKERHTSYVENEKQKEFLDRMDKLANDYNGILKDYEIPERGFNLLLMFDMPTYTAYENDTFFGIVRHKLK